MGVEEVFLVQTLKHEVTGRPVFDQACLCDVAPGHCRRDVARSTLHARRRPLSHSETLRANRYHHPMAQACAAEMWHMPFCMRETSTPVLQRCGARCTFSSVEAPI